MSGIRVDQLPAVTPDLANDLIPILDVSGNVLGSVKPNQIAGAASVPTGTGFRHVTSGAEDAATKLVENADVHASAAIAYSKLGTGTQSVGAQQFDSTVDAKGTERTVEPKNVQTTDATVTTLDSFTLGSNTGVIWTVVVAAIKSDNTQAAFYVRTGCFRNNAGTVAAVGVVQDGGTFEDDATWDCTIDNSTTTIRARVTGKAATTIRWAIIHQRLEVIP